MKKSLLWIVVLLLSIAMVAVFSLAGCKEKAAAEEEAAEEEVAEEEVAEEEVAAEEETIGEKTIGPIAEITEEPITINAWVIASVYVDWSKFAVEKLKEKYPNVDFNITIQSDEFIDTNLIVTLGTQPKDIDITLFWSGTRIQKLVDDGSVLNLDPWYEHYGWDDIFHPGASNANVVSEFGHAAFTVGWFAFTPFYNKDIFEQVGVTPPKTMDEWWEVCEKIKNAGFEVVAMGGKDAWPIHVFWNTVLGRYFNAEDANRLSGFSQIPGRTEEDAAIFKSEEAKMTWQFLADMNAKGYFSPGVNSLDWFDATDRFASGKAAMFIGFVPFTFTDAKAQDPNFPLDYFLMPNTDQTDNSIVVSYNDVLVIPAGVEEAKKPILAEFLNLLLTDPDVLKKAVELGILSASSNITTEEIVEVSKNEVLGRFFGEMSTRPAMINTDTNMSLALINEYYKLLMEVTEGTTTPEQACQIMYELALEEVE